MNIWCISKYGAAPAKYAKMSARLFYLSQEWNKLGHKIVLFTSDSNHLAHFPKTDKIYNYEDINGVSLYWIKTKKYQKTTSLSRIISWFDFERHLFKFDISKLEKPDVVLVSSLSIFSIVYGYFLKKKFNAKLVFEVRDIWPLTLIVEGGISKWHPLTILIGWIEKFGYKKADLIVGTMPRLDMHVKNVIDVNFRYFCSPLGFDLQNYSDVISDKVNPFESLFPKGKFIVGYAGSMGITNALEPFINMIKNIQEYEDIHFMLVGSGDYRERFKNELSICKNVTFLERIEQKDVRYFLDKCDIVYLSTKPSKVWEYGQSMNKVVEYMLAAKPIIATYTGFPSMLNEAKCGVFISSEDSKQASYNIQKNILKYYHMPISERIKIGLRGRTWIIQNRTYARLASEYLEVLENTVNKC